MDKLDKLLDYVSKEVEKYDVLADKAFERKNYHAYQLHHAEAMAYMKVRWAIEQLKEEGY